jgi:hypothetical protein
MTKNRLIEQLSAMGLLTLLMGALPAFADTRLEDLTVMALGPLNTAPAATRNAHGKLGSGKLGSGLSFCLF